MNPREHSGNQVFHHSELPVCLVCPYQILGIQLGEESIGLPWCKESVKNLPAIQDTQVQSLLPEDLLE